MGQSSQASWSAALTSSAAGLVLPTPRIRSAAAARQSRWGQQGRAVDRTGVGESETEAGSTRCHRPRSSRLQDREVRSSGAENRPSHPAARHARMLASRLTQVLASTVNEVRFVRPKSG